MSYTTLRYETDRRVGIVTFTNESALNSITEARLDELEAVLQQVEADGSLGALMLHGGEGRAFCVGLDLDLLDRAFDDIKFFERVVRRLNGIVTRLEALPIPTLAAVNGVARAGGFELTLGCDFIFIANEAKYGDVHTESGVLPAAGSLRLARRIGEQRAKDLVFSARWLTGPEAVTAGVALRSVPRAELRAAALAYLHDLCAKPRPCLASVKSVFQAASKDIVQAGAELELQAFVRYMKANDFGREAYRAFREGREASWKTGR